MDHTKRYDGEKLLAAGFGDSGETVVRLTLAQQMDAIRGLVAGYAEDGEEITEQQAAAILDSCEIQ